MADYQVRKHVFVGRIQRAAEVTEQQAEDIFRALDQHLVDIDSSNEKADG